VGSIGSHWIAAAALQLQFALVHTHRRGPPRNGKRPAPMRKSSRPRHSRQLQRWPIDFHAKFNYSQHRCLAASFAFWQIRISVSIAASAQFLGVMGDRIFVTITTGLISLHQFVSASIAASAQPLGVMGDRNFVTIATSSTSSHQCHIASLINGPVYLCITSIQSSTRQ
jgi:hypothetical protein